MAALTGQKGIKGMPIGLAALAAVLLAFALYWDALIARYGSPLMREVVLYEWINQKSKLSSVQMKVTLALLYKDVGDPDAVGMAISVLRSHLHEKEDEIVRHLLYVSYTTENPRNCGLALTGLRSVSPRHKKAAVAAFLYHLHHSDPFDNADTLKLVTCISGLSGYSYRDATPAMRELTNSPNQFLVHVAQEALAQLAMDEHP